MARESSDFYEGLAQALQPTGSERFFIQHDPKRLRIDQMSMSPPLGEKVIHE